ncbi:MAG: DUF1501 domain-containing protein [Deltaproteobacteria bacterium]|nr:DUF1501 domain-containing protein [Deltaproteobacteria bacterium]
MHLHVFSSRIPVVARHRRCVRGRQRALKRKVAIAALQSGVAVSANLHIGGFDTHSTHDEKHIVAAQNLFHLVDYTVTSLKAPGLWDRTVMLICSDFSRTIYNKPVGDPLRGKDHWPVTSLMAMGRGIPGGKVLGSTASGPLKGVVATSLKIDNGALVETETEDPNGFLLRPGHLHSALHASVGVANGEIEDQLLDPEILWHKASVSLFSAAVRRQALCANDDMSNAAEGSAGRSDAFKSI